MDNAAIAKAKSALESYIKGLVQDFINETGVCVEEIKIDCAVHPDTHTRIIKQVTVLEDTQALGAAFYG